MKDLGKLSPLFCSLQDGTFWSSVDKFSDEELQYFLPFLVSTCFHNSATGQFCPQLLARICEFADANRILQIVRSSHDGLEEKITTKCENNALSFAACDDFMKLTIIIRHVADISKDELPNTFINDDIVMEASMFLSIGYLYFPHLLPVGKTTLRLLALPHGPFLLTTMIMNSPELLNPVLNVLMGLQVSDEGSIGRQKGILLKQIFLLCPNIHLPILHDMALSKRDCLLAVRLACQCLTDEHFLSYILPLTWNKNTQLIQSLSKSSNRATLLVLQERLFLAASQVVKNANTEPHLQLLQALMTLQLNCGLKPAPEQLNILCCFICRLDINDDAYLEVALASLLAIYSLTTNTQNHIPSVNMETLIVSFLKHLAEESTKSTRYTLQITLVYVGVCLCCLRTDYIKAFLNDTFKNKVTIPPRNIHNLKTLFLNSCLSESELAKRCISLPVTANLNSASSGRLPIQSVQELLNTGSFIKQHVNLASWLEKQILEASVPVHPTLTEVVERFAADSVRSKRSGLSQTYVKELFEGNLLDEKLLTARVLVLLYLLSYRSHLDQLGIGTVDNNFADVYSRIPIRYLLSIVECRGSNYSCARASLIRLTTDIFPYMLPTVESVEIAKVQKTGISIAYTNLEVMNLIETSDINKVVRILDMAPLSDLVRFLPCIVALFTKSLDSDTLLPHVDSVIMLWSRLESIIPKMLYEKTSIDWLRCLQNNELSLHDIYEYPTLLFRCDKRILSSPQHFTCFIRLLSFFVSASKNLLMRSVHTAHCSLGENERQERDSLSIALDHTRGSLLVQLLVEVSDSKRMKDPEEPASLRRRRLVRKIACEYIHELFILDKNIMKLVLFQTFPLHMVPLLVEDVPSMFVARDYLQEMLSLPDINRRLFAISLMIHISKKYRIAATCSSTELILDVLHSLLRFCEASVNVQLFLRIVPTLAEINTVFPQLSADVTQLLMRVYSLAKNRLALNPLVIDSTSHEKKLLHMIKFSLSSEVEKD